MDSRDISRIERCMGLDMIVFKDGSVMNASEIAVSLFEEVKLLRLLCDSGNLQRVDRILDKNRLAKESEHG